MPEATFYLIDAFTDRAFAGNAAAVCLLDEPRGPEWMQSVAAEMNQSETAFVSREPLDAGQTGAPGAETGGPVFSLRWFTPTIEVALCGHATLAAAAALIEAGWSAAISSISGRPAGL